MICIRSSAGAQIVMACREPQAWVWVYFSVQQAQHGSRKCATGPGRFVFPEMLRAPLHALMMHQCTHAHAHTHTGRVIGKVPKSLALSLSCVTFFVITIAHFGRLGETAGQWASYPQCCIWKDQQGRKRVQTLCDMIRDMTTAVFFLGVGAGTSPLLTFHVDFSFTSLSDYCFLMLLSVFQWPQCDSVTYNLYMEPPAAHCSNPWCVLYC